MPDTIDISDYNLPELYSVRQQAVYFFNSGNNLRVSSGLAAETSNALSDFIAQVDIKIASFQINPDT